MPKIRLRREASASEVALAVLSLASVLAFARAHGSWALGILPVLGLAVTLDGAGRRLRTAVERVAWLASLLAGLAGVAWTFYFVLDEALIVQWRGVLGPALALISALLLAGQRVWPAARGVVPVSVALLVLAAIGPGERVTPLLAVAALALLAWLATDRPRSAEASPGTARRRGPWLVYLASSGVVAGAIISALPVAQPIVERATREILAGRGRSGLSESGSLGAVANMGLSRDVVLRMWSTEPGLMRARVHTDFDGRQWTSTPSGVRPLEPSTGAQPPEVAAVLDDLPGVSFATALETDGDLRAMKVLLARAGRGWVVTPPGARTLRLAGGTPTVDRAGVLKAPFTPDPALYGLAYATPRSVPLAPDEREPSMAVPDDLDPRLLDLARQIEAEEGSDRDRVDATLAYLAVCCTYALDVGAFATNQPVVEFLFEKRRGYCEYFASAAALILRLQGIPTRYVTGLSVRAENRHGDHYLVRASDAHAWIEVWLEGEGWVEFDPTPAGQYAALRADLADSWARRAFEAVASLTAEVVARVGTDWRAALGWMALGLVGLVQRFGWHIASILIAGVSAVVLLAVWRRRRSGPTLPPAPAPADRSSLAPELARLLGRLEKRWGESGHPRPSHRGHLEHLRSLDPEAMSPTFRTLSRNVIDCYYRARFGGVEPDAVELDRLWTALGADA